MIIGIEAEYQSDTWFTNDTPYPAITGELWGIFGNICEKIDHVIMASHCIFKLAYSCGWLMEAWQ